ncbi:MAG: D-alanyl-D-alanine carboxypeptidase [Lachnospiraceae bacterium]|nr:D-alanyl-D-alanine carboxypeptidase [Lachnospiraceae bacterium]
MTKRLLSIILIIVLWINSVTVGKANTELILQSNMPVGTEVSITDVSGNTLSLSSESVVLMEASTGTILYEKEKDKKLSPASITKIMTLILIFDSIAEGKIKLDDMVTTSAYAKSMGGSQVFLEEGEKQTVETLIKCIVIASGNDASVAMAEYISGDEKIFVDKMNERAKSLGMTGTHFEDCCGLTESDNHYTTANDVAIMSKELITKYPEITNYSTIWMENITHVTDKGSSEFGLTNTNKLLKQYEGTTGLKTGSTSKAKYCVSATANRNGIDLIAVVMAAPNYKVRFEEAKVLFNYGYANCSVYKDNNTETINPQKLLKGKKDKVNCKIKESFSYLSTKNENLDNIVKELEFEKIAAPVKEGDIIGYVIYKLDGNEIGRVEIIATETIKKAGFFNYFTRLIKLLWL